MKTGSPASVTVISTSALPWRSGTAVIPILKERLFGLTGHEGNHGEDVKEYYFYLDSTPTHSYMKYLYKYPQAAFPYDRAWSKRIAVVAASSLSTNWSTRASSMSIAISMSSSNTRRPSPEDICIRITGDQSWARQRQNSTVLPTIWFRNTWSWGFDIRRPRLHAGEPVEDASVIETVHEYYGLAPLALRRTQPTLLFTENETNSRRLYDDRRGAALCQGRLS